MHSLLPDIGVTVIAAAVLGVACHLLRQPLLLALVAAGVLIGPKLGFGFVHSGESIEVISELGLILLLFIVGLETNLNELKKSGKGLLLSGLGQFPFNLILGLGAFSLLAGIGLVPAETPLEVIYLAIMCSLSSTAIVVKVLYDKKDLTTLPGKLTLGVLVFQDLFAIFVLALQPNLADPSVLPVLQAVLSTVCLVVSAFLVSKFVLSKLYHAVSLSAELVISISLGWCALLAAAAETVGLSKEMGALVAGASISAFPYSTHVAARVLPLRDFFLTLFFVSLGMKIEAPTVSMIVPIILISTVLVVSRFLSVFPLVFASKCGVRASFMTSLNLAQMSEFSLVIAALGLSSGHISESMMSLTVYTMVILAIISSHMIKASEQLFKMFRKCIFWRDDLDDLGGISKGHSHEFIFLGFHRGARAFLQAVGQKKPELVERVLVVDFNPRRIEEVTRDGIHAVFGDVGNFEILRHIGLGESRIIVSIVPDMLLRGTNNCAIVRMARVLAPNAIIVATADDVAHEQELVREGAQIVLKPFDLAGREMIDELNSLLLSTQRRAAHPGATETLARRWTWQEKEILRQAEQRMKQQPQ